MITARILLLAFDVTTIESQSRLGSCLGDAIAEKGLAAHWKYKGIKSESSLDAWMNNVRDILEAAETGPMELMRNFKMDVYSREVFVFTPKGDLYKLPQGATLLDFAFNIHTRIGTHEFRERARHRSLVDIYLAVGKAAMQQFLAKLSGLVLCFFDYSA